MMAKDQNKWLEKIKSAAQQFWETDYPNKSVEEKKAYWQQVLEKAIKEQEKQGLSPYSAFNPVWYQAIQEQESEIERFIQQLFDEVWTDKLAKDFWLQVQIEEKN